MAESLRNLRTKLSRAADLLGGDVPPALAAVASPFQEAAVAFQASDKAARDAAIAWGKEAPEADAAVSALARSYDAAREATLARVPGLPDAGPASSHTTATETLEAAVILADVLGEQDPAWAGAVLEDLSPRIDAAEQEVDEKVGAGAARQKADQARAAAAGGAWERLRQLRRVVRRVYGPTSREYHSLRERSGATGATGAGESAGGEG